MAHIEVTRRSMSLRQWAELMFEQIESLLIFDKVETFDWNVRVGEYNPEGYVWDGPAKPINDGELWGRPDGSAVFTGRAVIPESMAGQAVYLHMLVAAEVIVWINGKILDGLDPNRTDVLLTKNARPGEELNLRLEAYSRSKPDDERSPQTINIRGCVQKFNQPSLISIDNLAQEVNYDLNILLEAAFSDNMDSSIRQRYLRNIEEILCIMPEYECSLERLRKTLPEIKKYLETEVFSENGLFDKHGSLACVAHSHLDIAYHWRKLQSIQKNARTCLIQIKLMEKYPDFKYAHSQAWCYEMLEKYYPELFAQVANKIKNGQWEIVGGMYVEPDCNLISAESMCRQIIFGKRYFLQKFNVEVDNCWLPDVFGNSAIMPQILKSGKIDYFVSNKMSTWNDTNVFPHNHFLWRGLDGTEIAACIPPAHFITWGAPDQLIDNWQKFIDKDVCKESLNIYGFGDGGSGVTEAMIANLNRANMLSGTPRLRNTTAKQFLEDNFSDTSKLYVWDGELYLEMHRGTFTTKGELKKRNRHMEYAMAEAETLSVLSSIALGEYPYDEIDDTWKLLLVNQFHDILPGSHTHTVYLDAIDDYDNAATKADKICDDALSHLIKPSDNRISVFNQFGFRRNSVAQIPENIQQNSVQNSKGEILPVQKQHKAGGGVKKVFYAADVSPLGFTNFEMSDLQPEIDCKTIADLPILESPFFRLKFDESGNLNSIFCKQNSKEIIQKDKTGNEWQLFEDRPGVYNAWDILDRFETHPINLDGWYDIESVENGPVSSAVRMKLKFSHSFAEQVIRVYSDIPRIDFETYVDWQETERLLKVAFPLSLRARYYQTDTSCGIIERPTHRNTTWEEAKFEVCCHKWLRLAEGCLGVSLLNDCKYGCDVKDNVMRLSLLRAPIRPDRTSDKGEHRFTYSIFTDNGNWQESGLSEMAHDLNKPMKAVLGFAKEVSSLFQISTQALQVQAVKLADDMSGDIILRLAEVYGSHGKVNIVPQFKYKKTYMTDLLERPLNETKQEAINYRPFEVMTFRFILR